MLSKKILELEVLSFGLTVKPLLLFQVAGFTSIELLQPLLIPTRVSRVRVQQNPEELHSKINQLVLGSYFTEFQKPRKLFYRILHPHRTYLFWNSTPSPHLSFLEISQPVNGIPVGKFITEPMEPPWGSYQAGSYPRLPASQITLPPVCRLNQNPATKNTQSITERRPPHTSCDTVRQFTVVLIFSLICYAFVKHENVDQESHAPCTLELDAFGHGRMNGVAKSCYVHLG